MTTDPAARIQLIGFRLHLKLTEDQKQDLLTKDHLSYYSTNAVRVVHFIMFSWVTFKVKEVIFIIQ